jgi:hypothetical protein
VRRSNLVFFRPYAVRPEPPAPSAEFEGNSPGNPREILRFQFPEPARGPSVPSPATGLGWVPLRGERLSRGPPDRTVRVKRIAEVQPQRAVGPEDPTHLIEHRREMVDEQFGIRFQAELAEPASASGAGPGGGELDVGSAVAGLDRVGVPYVRGRALPPGWNPLPDVGAGGVPSPEHGKDAVVPEPPVGRGRDDTVDRLVGQAPKNLPNIPLEDGRGEILGNHAAPSKDLTGAASWSSGR